MKCVPEAKKTILAASEEFMIERISFPRLFE
jgi:hypothetical protein